MNNIHRLASVYRQSSIGNDSNSEHSNQSSLFSSNDNIAEGGFHKAQVFCNPADLSARPTTVSIPRPGGRNFRAALESPPNFSWVDRGWLAGCASPTEPSHYKFLFEEGIRHVVSLMKERPTGAMESVQLPKMNRLKIRIDDNCAPTLQQVEQFLSIVERANEKKEAVAVHCSNGMDRTGTMLACYLVKMRRLNAAQALKQIRAMRPGSVESPEQERVIEQYYRRSPRFC